MRPLATHGHAHGNSALSNERQREWVGGAQAIVKLSKWWGAGSDPRKDGMAVGY